MFDVSLREVVNPRINGGDLNGRASASSPDPWINGAELHRSRPWRQHWAAEGLEKKKKRNEFKRERKVESIELEKKGRVFLSVC